MLMCLKYLITGTKGFNLDNKKNEHLCKQIIDICKDVNDENLKYFKDAAELIKQIELEDINQLKTRWYTDQLKKLIYKQIKQ